MNQLSIASVKISWREPVPGTDPVRAEHRIFASTRPSPSACAGVVPDGSIHPGAGLVTLLWMALTLLPAPNAVGADIFRRGKSLPPPTHTQSLPEKAGPWRRLSPDASANTRLIKLNHPTQGPEWLPDLAARATLEITRDGLWSELLHDADLQPGDIVLIPDGRQVEYDLATNAPFQALVIRGSLKFTSRRDTHLTVGTLLLEAGALTLAPEDLVQSRVTFDGQFLNPAEDPAQFSIGLVATGGELVFQGHCPAQAFSSLQKSLEPGTRVIEVADDVSDWQPGTKVYIGGWHLSEIPGPAGNTPVNDGEFAVVEKAESHQIVLTAPLKYRHAFAEPGIFSVANVSRNILLDSIGNPTVADPNDFLEPREFKQAAWGETRAGKVPPTQAFTGHVLFTHKARVRVHGACFDRLGRTTNDPLDDSRFDTNGAPIAIGRNPRGRYPLHLHHLHLAASIGNNVVIDRPNLRWSLTCHASLANITDNIVLFPGGAGLVTENGFEMGEIRHNLVVGNGGGRLGKSLDDANARRGAMNAAGKPLNDEGFDGTGYWLRGRQPDYVNNRAEGIFNTMGFVLYGFVDHESATRNQSRFPPIPGLPPRLQKLNFGQSSAVQGLFRDNQSYILDPPSGGAHTRHALSVASFFEYAIEGFRARGMAAIGLGYSVHPRFEGLDIVGLPQSSAQGGVLQPLGIYGAQTSYTMNHCRIEGFATGLNTPAAGMTVENSYFNNAINFVFVQQGDGDCSCHGSFYGREFHLHNVRSGPLTRTHIKMDGAFAATVGDREPNFVWHREVSRVLGNETRVVVRSDNGVPGDDYEVYFKEQAHDFFLPNFGVSNAELYQGKATGPFARDLRGRSFNDRILWEADKVTRPKVDGYVGPIDDQCLLYLNWNDAPWSYSPPRVAMGGRWGYDLSREGVVIPGFTGFGYWLGGALSQKSGESDSSGCRVVGGRRVALENIEIGPGINKYTTTIPGRGPYTFVFVVYK